MGCRRGPDRKVRCFFSSGDHATRIAHHVRRRGGRRRRRRPRSRPSPQVRFPSLSLLSSPLLSSPSPTPSQRNRRCRRDDDRRPPRPHRRHPVPLLDRQARRGRHPRLLEGENLNVSLHKRESIHKHGHGVGISMQGEWRQSFLTKWVFWASRFRSLRPLHY